MAEYKNILVEYDLPATIITVNRPKALNTLNPETINELSVAFDEIKGNKDVKGVILTGAGEKAFIAGADISRMPSMSPQEAAEFAKEGQELTLKMENFPLPIIAAVNGYALGGGTELSLACDFIYASKNAVFGQPEVNLGIIPGFGGTQRLARVVGVNMAMEIILTGNNISAEEALRIGLVNRIVEGDLIEEAKKTVSQIAKRGPLAVTYAKSAVRRGLELPIEVGLELEKDLFALVFSSEDRLEGVTAFLEKRKAEFKGK